METPFTDRTLRRYLAGALNPARREEVDRALIADPSLSARLALLEATTVGEELGAWRIPPPGANGRLGSLGGELRLAAAMGDEEAADYVELRLTVPEGMDEHRLAVLLGADGQWEVVLPAGPDEDRPLASWPREADGRLRLDLDAADATRRLAIALLPPGMDIDWQGTAPWAALQRGLAQGQVPVMSLAMLGSHGPSAG